uniref:Uncharacterized protein n=1 Tax=Opuntia streptacantha TaxID=393608 RepID=A0A7C8ZJH9_OPUST
MSSNAYRLCPSRNKPRNVLAKDWLSEDSAIQNVSDRPIGALPHLFQVKLFHTTFIWRNSCTFDCYVVLQGCFRTFNSNFVICSITMGKAKVVVFYIELQKWENKLLLYHLPDNTSHFITIHLNDGVSDLDLLETHGCF